MCGYYDELKGHPTQAGRGKKSNVAIIIPCFNETDLLSRHLSLLSRQIKKDFEVIVVTSSLMNTGDIVKIAEKLPFLTTILKRKNETGSAGGFFIGAKYAYNRGAKAVIFADVDAFPKNNDLVKALVGEFNKGADLVTPTSILTADGQDVARETVLNQYCLVSSRLISKAGFHFAPLYLGADDFEFMARLKGIAKPVKINKYVLHPIMEFGARSFQRSVAYCINLALISIPANFVYYLYFFGFAVPCMMVFGRGYAREAALNSVRCAFVYAYGKDTYINIADEKTESSGVRGINKDILVSPIKSGAETSIYRYASSGMDKIKNSLGLATAVFRKKTALSRINLMTTILSMMLCSRVWMLKNDNTGYLLADNGNIVMHALRTIAFCAILPFFALLSVFTLFVNSIRKPNTLGYGVEDGK
jgi:glycosyltransferase involved in cell wall biosynthesis